MLTARELEQINTTSRISGNDVVLDALLLRFHTETVCRRGGALGVLDHDRCLVKLREKDSTVRWQPITHALASCLVDHAAARGVVLPTGRAIDLTAELGAAAVGGPMGTISEADAADPDRRAERQNELIDIDHALDP